MSMPPPTKNEESRTFPDYMLMPLPLESCSRKLPDEIEKNKNHAKRHDFVRGFLIP
jgi:hypothetical protein